MIANEASKGLLTFLFSFIKFVLWPARLLPIHKYTQLPCSFPTGTENNLYGL